MTKVQQIIVTNLTEIGEAFARTTDTDEQVYIAKKMADAMNVEPFDRFEAILVPNRQHTERTPWFCLNLREIAEERSA